MDRAPRPPEAWLVALAAVGTGAWTALALDAGELTLPALCAAGAARAGSLADTLRLALAFNPPARLAGEWALMIAAMMSPLMVAPLRHLRARSFARRRPRAMLMFVAGYAAVWMSAGVVLAAIALVARTAAPAPLACLGLVAAVAVAWQVSPGKQWCLNGCHRRPALAAFFAAADRDAGRFGLAHGAACVGACWALMLLPLIAGAGHLVAMAAVTLLVFAERLDHPAPLAWRLRGPGKALRIIAAQARQRLAF
jgi:predicted metal-binding membrane protein